ncbi:hypothetical protein [Propionicimonas sp.]|uniref:hypothetical protein n=1 Tax=Propionicimonas sp. TaxID=1955623 RepID=UPI0039E70D7C
MSAPANPPGGKGCLLAAGVLAGVVVGVLVGTPLLIVGGTALFGERLGASSQRTDALAVVGVDREGGRFYASVEFADDVVLWLGSFDGGATWTKAAAPKRYTTGGYGSTVLACANSEVCYLAHVRTADGASPRHLVDRLDPDHRWHNELDSGEECSAGRLVVDPDDADRALVTCDGRNVARRGPDGTWKTVDLVAIASSLR